MDRHIYTQHQNMILTHMRKVMMCIYGKINNSAYTHRDASFNHRDASYNCWDARFNHWGTKCSSLYYELCVNLGA